MIGLVLHSSFLSFIKFMSDLSNGSRVGIVQAISDAFLEGSFKNTKHIMNTVNNY